mgnify:CR=1 FL=1
MREGTPTAEEFWKIAEEDHPGVQQVMGQKAVNLAGPVKVLSEGGFPEKNQVTDEPFYRSTLAHTPGTELHLCRDPASGFKAHSGDARCGTLRQVKALHGNRYGAP